MDKAFSQIIRRALSARLTETGLCARAGVSASRYSRAKNGKSGPRAKFEVIAALEAVLDELDKSGGTGYVYFAVAGEMVKIGHSRYPQSRLTQLSEWVPFKISLAATLPGTVDLEKAMHRRFAKHHCHGEWFHLSGEIESMIRAISIGDEIDISEISDKFPAENSASEKRNLSMKVTLCERAAGLSYSDRPDYIKKAMQSYQGSGNFPPSKEVIKLLDSYMAHLREAR